MRYCEMSGCAFSDRRYLQRWEDGNDGETRRVKQARGLVTFLTLETVIKAGSDKRRGDL